MKFFTRISKKLLICLPLVLSQVVNGQEDIIFSPADLIPHDDGYYIAGVDVDENNDGQLEHHNGCDDYYEDDVSDGVYSPNKNHEETGEQQEFKYFNCLIMPDCEPKGTPIEPPVTTGYIQMHACLYSNTDSAIYSYIQTPAVSNLVSITMETSSDVSINASRQVPYNIEYSKDNGATWENTYLPDNVAAQGGYRVTYDGTLHLEIEEMINASQEAPIVLRIITNDRAIEGAQQGQFVKLHHLKLVADRVTSINNTKQDPEFFLRTHDLQVISEKTEIEVYSIIGHFIGSGKNVEVPRAGIYIIKAQNGIVKKLFVE